MYDERFGRFHSGRERNENGGPIDDLFFVKLRDWLSNDKPKFLEEIEKNKDYFSVSSSQLRNIYDIVVDMNTENSSDVQKKLLKARIILEYAHKRGLLGQEKHFYNAMKTVMEDTLKSGNRQKVENFLQLFEAIIAYAKK